MSVEVVTVWTPRREDAQWRDDYYDLIALQRRTAHRFGHAHTIVTDDSRFMEDRGAIVAQFPESLMQSMIYGVVHRLSLPVYSRLVFVDCDVLINAPLDAAFTGEWDIGLTVREDATSPVNNGVMFVTCNGVFGARLFFQRALELCGTHWGADQEAISEAAAPVGTHLQQSVSERPPYGRIGFLNMKRHAAVPRERGRKHKSGPFCIHFKGDTKPWAQEYADKYILGGAQ